jgi:P-type Mg2+ transporter
VNQVAWLLIRFMFVMTPMVLFINGFTKGDWVEALLFALSIAVGLTPEMLPMIVTSTLAKGAVRLSRRKVIVKKLDSIQDFGAMDVLCTDKTGTLTQDNVFLSHHTDVWGQPSNSVLEYAYLNSHYQTGLKNLLAVALLEHAEVQQELDVATNFSLVDEIPFDFQRRRMSVVVAEHDEHFLLICKGAVDEVLSVGTRVRHGEIDEPSSRMVASSGSWATASTARRPFAPLTLAFRWIQRWISLRKRPISSCSKRASWCWRRGARGRERVPSISTDAPDPPPRAEPAL